MKPKEQPDRSGPVSMRLLLIAVLGMIPMASLATSPSWWANYGVVGGNSPVDYAAANQGQVKNIAVAAVSELDDDLAQFGGAGAALDGLAAALLSGTTAQTSDYSVVDLGALKAITQPFYDRLLALGYYGPPLTTGTSMTSGTYPWIVSGLAANDYAVANLGQVKQLFSFSVTYSSAGNGIPDWWVEKYFPNSTLNGQPWLDPNGSVAWSGTVTNQQAYQHGLNPTDFYNGTLPSFTAASGTALSGTDPGGIETVTVLVTDTNNNPIPGAPVTFSIDYGLLLAPSASASSLARTVQVAADANGDATVSVLTPWWPGVTWTVTATAETAGQTAVIAFSAVTSENDPAAPDAPDAQLPTLVSEPTLSETTTSISVGNPAFEQFEVPTNPTPGSVSWYLVQTSSGQMSAVDDTFDTAYSGTYSSVATVHPLFSGTTYSGASQYSAYAIGGVSGSFDSNVTEANDGSWSGTYTSDNPYGGGVTTGTYNSPFWGYSNTIPLGSGGAVSPTEESAEPTWPPFDPENEADEDSTGSASESKILSQPYTTGSFTQDVFNALVSSTLSATISGTGLGGPIAWYHLAADSSSLAIATGTYSFNCATTGSAPYVFEWYEVFQPDDPTQPIQATHREWDNANQGASSGPYTIGPSSTGTGQVNGTWYIARLDSTTAAVCPECRWRHVVGTGERVILYIDGLPTSISNSVQWTATLGTLSGTTNFSNTFTAGRTPGVAQIAGTLPGGATMYTNLTIEAPTGVIIKWFSEIPFAPQMVGAGMWDQYSFVPTNVSFSGCVYQERRCWPENRTGYYAYVPLRIIHNPNSGSGGGVSPPISPNTTWHGILDDNTANTLDKAALGPFNPTSVVYYYHWWHGGSGFTWNIPVAYRLSNDTDSGVLFPQTVTATMSITPGEVGGYTTTVVKGGIHDTQTFSPYLP